MPKEFQEDRRIGVTFTDQHGRQWNGTMEKSTMHPTGPLVPRFQAPLYPPHKFMKPVPGNPMAIRIDYEGWEEELTDAHAAYQNLMRTEAIRRYGQRASAAIADPPEELLMVIGTPPQPLQPVQAASDGDPFMLGETAEMPEWAIPYFAVQEEDEERRIAERPWLAEKKGGRKRGPATSNAGD